MADSGGDGADPSVRCTEVPSPPAFDANIHALILLNLLLDRSDGIPMWESEAGREGLTAAASLRTSSGVSSEQTYAHMLPSVWKRQMR